MACVTRVKQGWDNRDRNMTYVDTVVKKRNKEAEG
jgi:hypothetical protein